MAFKNGVYTHAKYRKYEVKYMENESIQNKIRSAFINKIQGCTDFNEDEIKQIGKIINSSLNADKIADELYKAIGGAASENT